LSVVLQSSSIVATINSTFAVSGHSRLPDHEALSDNRIHLTIDPQIPKIALETHPSVWTPTTFTIEMVKLIWTDDCHDCMVLDFASGSGILGIVAAKAGAKKVIFIDLNPQAIAISERNWQLNELPIEQCQLFQSNCFVAVEPEMLKVAIKLYNYSANIPYVAEKVDC
jgi:methylase of polypeptide subunit release factors